MTAAGNQRPFLASSQSASQRHTIVSLAGYGESKRRQGSFEQHDTEPRACLNNLKDLNLSPG